MPTYTVVWSFSAGHVGIIYRISVVEEDTNRLCNELSELREQRASKEQEKQNRITTENVKKEAEDTNKLQKRGPVPGLLLV